MSSPEDFRGRLKRALEEKNQQKAVLRKKKKKAKARRIEREKRDTAATIEKKKRIKEELGQRNQTALGLDNQLPIAEYMEGLKAGLALKKDVEKWGPDNGKIAYSLVYHTSRRKIHVSNHFQYSPPRQVGRGEFTNGYTIAVENFRSRKTQAVLGVVLDHKGSARVYNQTCAKRSLYHPKSINPLTWLSKPIRPIRRPKPSPVFPQPEFPPALTGIPQQSPGLIPLEPAVTPPHPYPLYSDSYNKGVSFDLNSEKGLEKLTQNLIGFYLAQKG